MPLSGLAKWICHETASLKQENTVFSCGVGTGKTEAAARADARTNANQEFKMICSEDIKCKGYKTEISPMRNSCVKSAKGYKCYRGLEYKVTKVKATVADMEELDRELERKKEEYEIAKEKYQKKKEIEELEERIKNKNFEEQRRKSNWVHTVIVAGGLGYYNATTSD